MIASLDRRIEVVVGRHCFGPCLAVKTAHRRRLVCRWQIGQIPD